MNQEFKRARLSKADMQAAGLVHEGPARRAWRWSATRWSATPWPLRVLAGLLLVLFAIWLVLFITKGRFLKHPAESIASRMLGRDLRVAGDFQLYFAPIDLKIRAEGLTIANPRWLKGPFFSARLIDGRLSTFRLLFGQRVIKRLELDRSAVDLQWSRNGRLNSWTFGSPDAPAKPLEMPDIRTGKVTGSRVHFSDPRLALMADIDIASVAAANSRVAETIGFTGRGRMRGLPFTLDGRLLTPNASLAGGENKLVFHARSGATQLDADGVLRRATQLDGAHFQLKVRGPDISQLFDFLGVALPATRTYSFTSQLDHIDNEWRFQKLTGRYGQSDLAGKMTISLPKDRLLIVADLKTDRLHMIDIAPFVGYDLDRLEARGAAGLITTVNGAPRILPDAPLRVDAIRRFDAKLDYAVRTVEGRNIPISNIGLKLDLDKGMLKLSPLTFMMAGGLFASDVDIDARGAPVRTSYDIRLSPTPMGKLLARWGVEESGTSGTIRARAQLKGLGDTVRESLATSNGRIAVIMPKGTMWARNIQLAELDIGVFIQKMFEKRLKDPVEINCGLIAFTVRDGVASADPILIDTTKNVILGRGAFSFRDERLDLALRADGKKFSLFSGQSPIGLAGYFAAPRVDVISPELLARGAAGLGLAALTPLAAVFAFVDVGDAKSADCSPVLAGAQARAQRTTSGTPRDDVGRGTPSKSEGGR